MPLRVTATPASSETAPQPVSEETGPGAPRLGWTIALPSHTRRWFAFLVVAAMGGSVGAVFCQDAAPLLPLACTAFAAVLSGFTALWSS